MTFSAILLLSKLTIRSQSRALGTHFRAQYELLLVSNFYGNIRGMIQEKYLRPFLMYNKLY